MTNLNLDKHKGQRCWATDPLYGMMKRPDGKATDTEVSFHLVPSRAGANAGEKYANAVVTSAHYNKLELKIWTDAVYGVIGKSDFKMTVEWTCGIIT